MPRAALCQHGPRWVESQERPHEALGQRTPSEVYEPARRDYPERLPEPRGYPDDWQKRKVRGSGQIKWKGRNLRITGALIGHEIGLQPVGEGEWAIYFEHLELGRFDERNHRVKPNPRLAQNRDLG